MVSVTEYLLATLVRPTSPAEAGEIEPNTIKARESNFMVNLLREADARQRE
jgi:hypothetical protein